VSNVVQPDRRERRPEPAGVDAADGARVDAPAGQLGDVLPAAGRAHSPSSGRSGEGAADTCVGDQLVDLVDDGVDLGRILAGVLGVDAGSFQIGADGRELPLLAGGAFRFEDGFGVEVPPFTALSDTEPAGTSGAGWALAGEGGTAGTSMISASPVTTSILRTGTGRCRRRGRSRRRG
jgi:hypothetical protein